MKAITSWERENRTHFDKIVENYDKIRWSYPDELFADIIEYSGPESKKALEIGAGTGKATAPFLDAGFNVTAVEMSGNMADFITKKFRDRKKFSIIVSTFEDAVLEEDSYDLIYAASAFHWVDAEIGCPKAYRLLKKDGTIALFRNNTMPFEEDELFKDIQAVYNKHYYSHYKIEKRPINLSEMTSEDFLRPSEIYRRFRFESLEQYGFRDVAMKICKTSLIYSADEYVALLDTYSDHRALPDDSRAALYEGVKEAILKHGGQNRIRCVFQLYMGRK